MQLLGTSSSQYWWRHNSYDADEGSSKVPPPVSPNWGRRSNIQVQIQAEEGEENTETWEPNQDPEDQSAEVQRPQPAGEGRRPVRRLSCCTFYVNFSALLTREKFFIY